MQATDHNEEFYEELHFVTDPKQQPMRIDKFLVNKVERVTRNKVQNAIRAGSVLVNGKPVKPNHKLKAGDEIKVILTKPPKEGVTLPENIPLDIRYEDDDLLVLYKPPGLVVHPGIGNHSGTLVNALAYHFRDLPIMQGNRPDRPGIVHRIDKRYVTLVWSEPPENEGTIIANIGRHPRHRVQMTTFEPDENEGKNAITHYKVLERLYYVSLVECNLETGRTHQIRVHMKSIGCPVFNDEKYGGDRVCKGTVFTKYKRFVENCFDLMPRQGLHAKELGFVHPTTGKEMMFVSDLPDDMAAVLERWRVYLAGRKTK